MNRWWMRATTTAILVASLLVVGTAMIAASLMTGPGGLERAAALTTVEAAPGGGKMSPGKTLGTAGGTPSAKTIQHVLVVLADWTAPDAVTTSSARQQLF